MKCRACLLDHSPLLRCEVAARRAQAAATRPVAAVLRAPAKPAPKPDRRRR